MGKKFYTAFGTTLAIIATPAVLQLGNEVKALSTEPSAQEAYIGDALSEAYGKEVVVDCYGGLAGKIISLVAQGYTVTNYGYESKVAHLPSDACSDVVEFSVGASEKEHYFGVYLAAHEGGHAAKGIRDEKQVTCIGLRHYMTAAKALGRNAAMQAEPVIEIAKDVQAYLPEYYDVQCFQQLVDEILQYNAPT
ncbi:MAG TPA: hypothetical protein VK983_03265 [Candidatus Limnocylindrales bacterium]|nr:hypothetical protein [Candidatus Limnocylindrales bacterium]